jgi:hypothetical protein
VEEIKQPSTNALARFVLFDGHATARVIAKWAPVYAENNEGLTEFGHYRRFNSCWGREAFGCPRPLCFVKGENVLLTEEQEGVPLRDACHSALHRRRSRQILRAVILSGRWLNAFHHLTPPAMLPMSSAWVLLEWLAPCIFDAYLAKSELGSVVTSQMRRQMERVRRILAHCSCACKVGTIHRDFGPGNILVSSKAITVLDAACNKRGPQLIDVADFFAYMRLLSTVTLRTTQTCENLIDEFWNAYLGSGEIHAAERALLDLLIVGATARNLERHLGAARSLPAPLRRVTGSYCIRRYRRMLETLIAKTVDSVGKLGAPMERGNKGRVQLR